MHTFARGMMARKETVGGVECPWRHMGLKGSRTDEYESVFVRFGEVQCPLGTKKV